MKAGDRDVLRDFFRKWQEVIEEFHITPEHIYNWDEKGVMIGLTGREWVLAARDRKEAYAIQDGNRESVTVIECASQANISAFPHILPPYIISAGNTYTAANFRYLVETEYGDANILKGAVFRKSKNGYTDNKIGFDYIKWFDLQTREFADNGRIHRLALVDGHSSHLTLEIIEYCMQPHVNIHIVCLPAHSTHILQPMDVGIFGPLSRAYKKEVSAWCRDRTNGRMSFASFLLCYHRARETAITNRNVQKAFEATGLLPLNPRVVLDSRKVR
ncbi:DDE-domain-containing protein, partial [Ascobolus immersus RN42]